MKQEFTSPVGHTNAFRILVAEDDSQFRAVVRDMLADDGYAVTPVADGLEAVAKMDMETFDLVITDLLMPRMNGIDLLTVVKQRWPDVPVIAITAWGNPRLVSETERKGAVACLQKPFTMRSLKQAVGKASHKRGRNDDGESNTLSG